MKKIQLIFVAACAAFLFNACSSSPLTGSIFTNTEFSTTWAEADAFALPYFPPTHTNLHMRSGPLGLASVAKRGQHCKSSFFPVNIIWFDLGPSVERAMEDGGITRVAIVDRKSLNVLGLIYQRECIVVYGE